MRCAAIVAVTLGTAGCLWENPGYDPTAPGATAGGATTGGATTGGATAGGATAGPGSATDATGGAGGTDGGMTGSIGGSTGGSTDGGTTAATTGGMLGSIGCPDHPDLLACYLFEDEPPGVLLDRSGNTLDFVRNEVTLGAGPPNHGTAGVFSAASVVQIAENPAFDLDTLTISLLVMPAGGDAQILDNDQQYGLRYNGGKIDCTIVLANGDFVTVVADVVEGVWSHVFCSFDGASFSLFVEALGEQTVVSGPLKKDATNGVVLGNENPAFDLPFTGSIDHVLVFGVGLPEAERCKYGLVPCP